MNQFRITDEIYNLDLENIKDNLFKYSYRTKNLKSFDFDNVTIDSPNYATYSSLKGEVFENVIYEYLVQYALNEPLITRFVLKGPHQNNNEIAIKSGMAIDKSAQIVYKSAYKDITEYDALFFTKESVYFVEMSITKKTSSLNKRLNKKHALLKLLFPSLDVRALIVLTEGSIGIKRFPSYCTIWLTKDFTNDVVLRDIVHRKQVKKGVVPKNKKRFVEAKDLKYTRFSYFQTLEWILIQCRSNPNFAIDLRFFQQPIVQIYFDIFTKLYIGFISTDDFKNMVDDFDKQPKENKIFVTIEKINHKSFDIVYYLKEVSGKLKRMEVNDRKITYKDKDQEGFTNIEVRFIIRVLKDNQQLKAEDIEGVKELILQWK